MEAPTYSFVIPVYNEEETLKALHDRMASAMAKFDGPAEVILINDGSRDNSLALMLAIQPPNHASE